MDQASGRVMYRRDAYKQVCDVLCCAALCACFACCVVPLDTWCSTRPAVGSCMLLESDVLF